MTTKATLAEFTIRLASEAQKAQGLRAAHVPWGGGMAWEEFLDRWNRFEAHDTWLREGSVCVWVLVRRDDLDGPIYSFCLTYRRKSFLKEPKSSQVKEVFCYAISAVVTPVEHLRNGFATHLLRLLHYHLADPSAIPAFPIAEWGAPPPRLTDAQRAEVPPGIASMLFSAVGPTFYERATIGLDWPGWIITDETCQRINWALRPPMSSADDHLKKVWNWIYARDLPAIGELLSQRRRKELSAAHQGSTSPIWAPDPSSTGTLTHVPSQTLRPQSEDWHTLYHTQPVGTRLPHLRPGEEEAIILFTVSERRIGRGVLITYIDNLDADRLPMLLDALDEVGAKAGVDAGIVWGVTSDSPLGKAWAGQKDRAVQAGVRSQEERGGNLLGVAWYGSPEDRARLVDTQIWNWC